MREIPVSSNAHLASTKLWLTILSWIGPVIMGIASGYGSVTFTEGVREQRIISIEYRLGEAEKQIERNRERAITREELKAYLDGETRTLEQIQADIRALRNQK